MEKKYDLEDRTLKFSTDVIKLVKNYKQEYLKSIVEQVIRSATSVGANYIEANDALGKKDFLMRLRISRKECKETIYWLKILAANVNADTKQLNALIDEAVEIRNILSAIISKVS
jgi:four helix bundle protein